MAEKIGVYVCDCGTNIAHTVDVADVVNFASTLPEVEVAREYKYMCSDPGQDIIKKDIKALGLTRVVVASCSPLMHEPTFREAVKEAGLNPYLFQMANIREQCSWVTENRADATEKAKALVSAAIRRVALQKPLEPKKVSVNPDVLIVGAGITGIEAALKCADAGKKVYLVERTPSIGGHMAQFDKTFPTLDCSACILTPKMTSVGRHPNIELLTYSEIEEVSGFVGNFKVKINQKPRFINSNCSGCSECESVCPVEMKNEYEAGLVNRKAIYRPFAQAVPSIFVIDKKGTAPCRMACPAGTYVQGYIALLREGKYKKALDCVRRTVVLPSVCGRVCYHRCENECARGKVDEPIAINALKRFLGDYALNMKEKPEPLPITEKEKVAVIGSGPTGLTVAYQLLLKGFETHIYEASDEPGGMCRWTIPSFRLPKEILKAEIDYIKDLGVKFHLNTTIGDSITIQDLFTQGYAAIHLAVGSQKSMNMGVEGENLQGVMPALEFLHKVNEGKKIDIGDRVAVIGGGSAAMDAARSALRSGARDVTVIYRRSYNELTAHPVEIQEAEEEGVKFKFLAAPVKINGEGGKVTSIDCIQMDLGSPDASGRCRPVPVEGSNFSIEVDSVIPAVGQKCDLAFLPKEVKTTKWNTIDINPITFETSIAGLFAGGDCVYGPASVVESFQAGIEGAESIYRYLKGIDLTEGRPLMMKPVEKLPIEGVEKTPREKPVLMPTQERLKGFAEVEQTLSEEAAHREAERCLDCGGCCECMECVTACGDRNAVVHNMDAVTREVDVGAIILATGFNLFNATPMKRYGYGKLPNVWSSLEFERYSHASGPTGGEIKLADGRAPKSVAIIHCIGSRDSEYHQYCSRVCCMYAMKFSHLVREKTGAKTYEFYIDIRAFGKGYEEFYNRMLHEDVEFIRGKVAEVTDFAETEEEKGKLVVCAEDTLLGMKRRVPVDLVILCNALSPREDAHEIARIFSLSRSKDGFFLEKHPKLAPVATANDGVYIAGACQGPKDIPDSVAQGLGAASEALALIDKQFVKIEPIIGKINEDLCSGCRICNELCPYGAIEFDEEKHVSRIIEAVCKGCGTCAAACPSGCIVPQHFTDDVIMAEIEGILANS